MNHSLQFVKHSAQVKAKDLLSLVQVPLPPSVSDGHIRIRVAAAPINPADGLFINGVYDGLVGRDIAAGKPQTAGSEGAGVVWSLGGGVSNFTIGQRVYFSANFPNTGSWAEYIDVPAQSLIVPLPDAVSFEKGCQLLVNPCTAHGFLETCARDGVVAGDYVVLTAAGSAVGRMFIDLNNDRKVGLKPIAIVRREEQKAELEARGAIAIASSTEDVKVRLAEITGGKGVKICFDALGGGPVASAVVDSLQLNGGLYFYGLIEFGKPWTHDPARALFKQTKIEGWYMGHRVNWGEIGKTLGSLLDALGRGAIRADTKTFDLVTEWNAAFNYLEEPGITCKPVLITKQ